MSFEVIKTVRQLIETGTGDTARLEHILDRLESGKYLYLSDQKYLENLLSSNQNITSKPAPREPHEFEDLEIELKDINTRLEKMLQNKERSDRNIIDDVQIRNIESTHKSSMINNEKLRPKSEDITLTLSVVLGLISLQGIGHIYLNKTGKGFGILLSSMIISSISVSYVLGSIKNSIPLFLQPYFIPLMIATYFGLYVFQILDSRKICAKYNAYLSEHKKIPHL
jgi:hypothetical protein